MQDRYKNWGEQSAAQSVGADTVAFSSLLSHIKQLRSGWQQKSVGERKQAILLCYWSVGRYIITHEQNFKMKAPFGKQLLQNLSEVLGTCLGTGYSHSNIIYMRLLYLNFPDQSMLSQKLKWSHYFEILKTSTGLEVAYYVQQTENEGWDVRELRLQIKNELFYQAHLRDIIRLTPTRKKQEVKKKFFN
jgi:hypothetical protein